jgi:hypothetical protein
MKKLMSILIAASFATLSVGAFAAAHGGAPKDGEKMDCKKMMDEKKPMDDKMKAECKKMMEEKKKEEPKK